MGKLGVIILIALIGCLKDSSYPSAYGYVKDVKRNLKYYELLNAVDLTHHIVKRGATPSPNPYNHIKELQFNTLGR